MAENKLNEPLPQRFLIGDWCVETTEGRIQRENEVERLRPLAMKVLVYLAECAPNLVPVDELMAKVWAPRIVADDAVAKVISNLRKKLRDDTKNPVYIETIPRRGYRIVAVVHRFPEEFRTNVTSGRLTGLDPALWLSPTAVEVLICLSGHNGKVVSKETLYETVGAQGTETEVQISKAINELRRAFGDYTEPRRYIETIPKRGYRLLSSLPFQEMMQSIAVDKMPNDSTEVQEKNPGWRWVTQFESITFYGMLILVFSLFAANWLVSTRKGESVVENTSVVQPILSKISFSGQVKSARISPDGQFIAYVNAKGIEFRIHDLLSGVTTSVLPPDNFTTNELTRCSVYDWSPAGTQILAACSKPSSESTFVIARLGGISRELFSDASRNRYGRSARLFWTADDQRIAVVPSYGINEFLGFDEIQFEPRSKTRLPVDVSVLANQRVTSVWIAPDKSMTIVTHDHTAKKSRIFTAHMESSTIEKVFETEDSVRRALRSADGQFIFFLHSNGPQTSISKLPLAQPQLVQLLITGGFTDFSLSGNGKLVVVRNTSSSNLWSVEKTAEGVNEPVQLTKGTWFHNIPNFSTDGRRITFSRSRVNFSYESHISNIFTMGLTGGNLRQLTHFESSSNLSPTWSPDDRSIAFISDEGGIRRVWTVNADGSNIRQTNTPGSHHVNWATSSQILSYLVINHIVFWT